MADLQVPLSLGVQTGGSVIRPAAYTGIFAMKPSHNAISTEGQKTVSSTFDTVGFFARSIEDLQLIADIFAIKDDELPTDVPLGDSSTALVKTSMWNYAGPGTVAAMNKIASILQSNGTNVDEIEFPTGFGNEEALNRMQTAIIEREAQVAFLPEYRAENTKLSPEICSIVENSNNVTQKEYLQALDKYASLRPIVDNMLAKCSVVVAPSAVDEAPLGLDDMGSPVFNTLWTVSCMSVVIKISTLLAKGLHVPVIHIPAFNGSN